MKVICPRCGGYKIIPCYKHIEEGICFLCEGAGEIEKSEADKFILNEIKKDKQRAKRNEKRELYCKEQREKQEAYYKNLNKKKDIKTEEKIQPMQIYEGSAQEALDLFYKLLNE